MADLFFLSYLCVLKRFGRATKAHYISNTIRGGTNVFLCVRERGGGQYLYDRKRAERMRETKRKDRAKEKREKGECA